MIMPPHCQSNGTLGSAFQRHGISGNGVRRKKLQSRLISGDSLDSKRLKVSSPHKSAVTDDGDARKSLEEGLFERLVTRRGSVGEVSGRNGVLEEGEKARPDERPKAMPAATESWEDSIFQLDLVNCEEEKGRERQILVSKL